jgi:perosamine synthetase
MNTITGKFVNIDQNDIDNVLMALHKRKLNGNAEIVKTYESQLATYFGSRYALACCNGTSAIYLALLALSVSIGDEVVVPPTAPIMTVLPILAIGAIPVFSDVVNNASFGFSPSDLQRHISSRTRAIITVPMWGYPIAIYETLELARQYKIPIIEDCSQAHGTRLDNHYYGTFGDIGVFSTHDRKLVCTGEGAFILTNTELLYQKMIEMRSFGIILRRDQELAPWYGQFGMQFGLNFKISALSAALGCSQLVKLDNKIQCRTFNGRFLETKLEALDWLNKFPIETKGTPNYYSALFFTNKHINSYFLAEHLTKDGIITDVYDFHYTPLYHYPILKQYASNCPNAECLCSSLVTLPSHEGLTNEDLQRIVDCLTSYTHNDYGNSSQGAS